MTFKERLNQGVVLFDGAMGTQIHELNPTMEEWDHKEGCSEILNLTIPEKIKNIHKAYLHAGADVIETNTFGANQIVLDEYGLKNKVREINRVAAELAQSAASEFSSSKPRFVAGSIGPGTKLASLGQISFDALHRSYFEQAMGLIDGKVDLFLVETCQDPLQIKAALIAIMDAQVQQQVSIPMAVTVTVETTGTLLVGSELQVIITALKPYPIVALGINCATGPDKMHPYISQLCEYFDGPVMVQPNAGLPQNLNGQLTYTFDKNIFADILASFIEKDGVSIVGGCCGTTPEFINTVHHRVAKLSPAKRTPQKQAAITSLYTSVLMDQDPAPFFVGERTNTNGSRAFKELLLENQWDKVVDIAREQMETGAHGLDLCVAFAGRDEISDMAEAATRIIKNVNLPLFFDSTQLDVMEHSLKLYGGKAVINSINLENGEERAHEICRIAKRYGAALVALTIDEKGMALEVDRKISIAKRIYDIAVNNHGIAPEDLIFDALTFTLGSGDESLKTAGINTLEGIRGIKENIPGVKTILGLSNISFGLKASSRVFLNSVFLAEAVKSGLDMAIVDVKKILPLYKLDEKDLQFCLDLIYNRGDNILFDFINHFDAKSGDFVQEENKEELSLEEKIRKNIVQGKRTGMNDLLLEALKTRSPLGIINELLIPAMKIVGELFGSGKMQLPFVLQSAEVMKSSVDILEPYMEKTDEESQTSIVLATVRGDVHDIGKNLVDIILSNNGFKVHNLGIKCEIDTILDKVEEVKAHAIGMSGLLVKSSVIMKENLEEMKRRNIEIPVLLGGAALTKNYVDETCAPVLNSPVIYCMDAFKGLEAMNAIKDGTLKLAKDPVKTKTKPLIAPVKDEAPIIISRNIDIPQVPFWGSRVLENISLDEVFEYITEEVLFRGRWGYRRGAATKDEYDDLINNTVRPEYEKLKIRCKNQGLLQPKAVYGYWPCNSENNDVIIFKPETNKEILRFNFPRQNIAPHLCISDFFYPVDSGKRDIIAFQLATVGEKASETSQELYKSNVYKDYLLFHGLSVEAAEALAELNHLIIRKELNIIEEDGKGISDFVVQKYRGSRYSFGYPACPDLKENRKIFDLLEPERIGVRISDEDQMIPEQTTSAFVVHHPQAKYFRV
ncbi:MAG: methionine synthase [Spirochaetales bacterium]|nr:methionine synthase [Spirochaetales bacterium]